MQTLMLGRTASETYLAACRARLRELRRGAWHINAYVRQCMGRGMDARRVLAVQRALAAQIAFARIMVRRARHDVRAERGEAGSPEEVRHMRLMYWLWARQADAAVQSAMHTLAENERGFT